MLKATFALMKIIAQILLLLFVAFLITPTVVSIIEKNNNASIIYSFSEEEHSHKGFKVIFDFYPSFEIIQFLGYNSSLILSENLSKHDAITASIFIPPPNCLRSI